VISSWAIIRRYLRNEKSSYSVGSIVVPSTGQKKIGSTYPLSPVRGIYGWDD